MCAGAVANVRRGRMVTGKQSAGGSCSGRSLHGKVPDPFRAGMEMFSDEHGPSSTSRSDCRRRPPTATGTQFA